MNSTFRVGRMSPSAIPMVSYTPDFDPTKDDDTNGFIMKQNSWGRVGIKNVPCDMHQRSAEHFWSRMP